MVESIMQTNRLPSMAETHSSKDESVDKAAKGNTHAILSTTSLALFRRGIVPIGQRDKEKHDHHAHHDKDTILGRLQTLAFDFGGQLGPRLGRCGLARLGVEKANILGQLGDRLHALERRRSDRNCDIK
jgi:hypothetical protein